MTIHATLVLDSGAFFQNIQPGTYERLDIGFFGSGGNAAEINVSIDGNPITINETKLGIGEIEVLLKKAVGSAKPVEVTQAFSDTLLRMKDLYPTNTPEIDQSKFDCRFVFTSGRFCCSMVKVRPFQECMCDTLVKTEQKVDTKKAISHNVAVHFELDSGDTLQLVRNKTDVLFTTATLSKDVKRIDIDIVADNSTAVKFFHYALKFKGSTAWLPNQGDPPTVGPP